MENGFEKYKISEEIKKSIDAMGYKNPSDVQKRVIPEALEGKDIVVKSQTGSGKTAAFAIPVCEKVIWDNTKPQALVLTPTREHAIQVKEVIQSLGRLKRIRVAAIFGKQPFSEQIRELKQRTHIVVGTPGRVIDHIERGTFDITGINILVIDEADEMLNMGFVDQVKSIVSKLNDKRQTMLFSATMPEEILDLSNSYMNNPENIEIKAQKLITDKITHELYKINEEDKLNELRKVLIKEIPEGVVVFCKTKENVDKVAENLKRKGYSVDKIHGGMMQKDRMATMERFKKGFFRILVATDIAARGIDVEGLTHVINYDLPVEKEAYVHRIGRTGRAGSKGKAISLVNQYEGRLLGQIQEYIGFEINEIEPISNNEIREKEASANKLKTNPKVKKNKTKEVEKAITKIYLNGGKKKKIRAGDIVGAISRIDGVNSEDIGIIDVQDIASYVDILNGKGNKVLNALKDMTIKGKKLRVERAKK